MRSPRKAAALDVVPGLRTGMCGLVSFTSQMEILCFSSITRAAGTANQTTQKEATVSLQFLDVFMFLFGLGQVRKSNGESQKPEVP
jgi:hypothetical protein